MWGISAAFLPVSASNTHTCNTQRARACTHTYAHTRTHMHTHAHTCTHTHTQRTRTHSAHAHTHVHVHVHVHAHAQIHTHAHKHARTHTGQKHSEQIYTPISVARGGAVILYTGLCCIRGYAWGRGGGSSCVCVSDKNTHTRDRLDISQVPRLYVCVRERENV